MTEPRIYDNPNHKHYGPVRRMWVILAGLDLLGMDEGFFVLIEETNQELKWDGVLIKMMQSGFSETEAKNCLLQLLYQALAFKQQQEEAMMEEPTEVMSDIRKPTIN